jgi:signal peptidase I
MKTWLRENRGFLVFLLCFGVFRTAVADWNPIPSASMRPTLLEGDVVLVNRLAYDLKLPLTDRVIAPLAEPQRGDVVTFSSPADGVRLIKRLIALPGDRVELRDEQLIVNGMAARYEKLDVVTGAPNDSAVRATESFDQTRRTIQVMPGRFALRSFGPLVVPEGHYFFLGDNRDNSADSRFFGPVPRHLLIGRAHRILASADILGGWQLRLDRFGRRID